MKFNSHIFAFYLIFCSIITPITEYQSAQWKTYNKQNTNLPSNNILCLEIDTHGNKWIGTDNGLVKFDGNVWKLITTESENNLADNYINNLLVESQENQLLLWVAKNNGVSLIDISNSTSPEFTALYRKSNSNIVSDHINVLTVDRGQTTWFGTFSGISNFHNNNWSTYSAENYWIDNNKVVSLESGPDSMVYIGTEGGGVSRLKMNGIDGITSASTLNTEYTGFDEPGKGKLTSDNIYAILIEENGTQWFGTDEGIALHTSYNTRRDWKNYTTEDGLINNFIQTICKESEDIFWIGTPEGVSKIDGDTWTNFTSANGLAHNNVRDIVIDKNGIIWFATENGISSFTNTATSILHNRKNSFNLLQVSNYPNPFNMQTSIKFSLSLTTDIELKIFNSNGQHIKSLESGTLKAGEHKYFWNGINSSEQAAPSGIYFVQLLTGKQMKTHKIMLLK